jgi:circadian clock protein KaiC
MSTKPKQTLENAKREAEDKVELELVQTGVPGLDEILSGGVPRLSFNVIVGPPGSGKTTLAMQILFKNATTTATGLFVSLVGEPPLKLLRYQQQFSFFDVSRVGTAVHFLNLAEAVAEQDLDNVLKRIVKEVERVRPGLVVIDSFRGFIEYLPSRAALEGFVHKLAVYLTSWEVTSFLIGESGQTDSDAAVLTVADGILALNQDVERNSMVRKLQIIKLRGRPSMPGLHTVRITEAGMQVYPRMPTSASEMRRVSQIRLSTGIHGLDEMMAGGIPAGDATIIAGPTGSGKTTFATLFIAEGLRCGESCVIIIFEERPETYATRAKTAGINLEEAIAAGKLKVIYLRPLDLSVDETFDAVAVAVKEMSATRVVVDSISGLEMALAPTFRQDFRESLYRLVNAVTGLGVTIVMTVEVVGPEQGLQFTNFGVSFLTDHIIVQRYAELDGQLRKVVLVVKMRGSKHSRDFRTYEITQDGVVLGNTLHDYVDIISGTPRRQPRTRPLPHAGLTEKEVLVLESLIGFPQANFDELGVSTYLQPEELEPALTRLLQLGYAQQVPGSQPKRFQALARTQEI